MNSQADVRSQVWGKLAGEWKPGQLSELMSEVSLEGVEEKIQAILRGGIRGRVVVKH